MNVTRECLPDPLLAQLIAGVKSLQDRACILLALGTGLRLGELAALNVGSVVSSSCDEFEARPEIAGFVLVTQGRQTARLPVGPSVLEALNDHLDMRAKASADPLFVHASGHRVRPEQLSLILRKWCVRIGLEPLSYAYMPSPSLIFQLSTDKP